MAWFHDTYLLLTYRDSLGNVEVVWNTVRAMAPTIILSRAGRVMHNVRWTEQVYEPHHTPVVGDRIFVKGRRRPHLVEVTPEMQAQYQRWHDGEK